MTTIICVKKVLGNFKMTQLDIILALAIASWLGIFLMLLNNQNIDKGTAMGKILIVATIILFILVYLKKYFPSILKFLFSL